MKRLVAYFLRGVVLLAPLAVTIYVIAFLFRVVDGWLARFIGTPFPGAGFALSVVLITAFGFLASGFLTRRALAWLERLMERLPLVRLLYTSTRDLLNAFVGERRRFNEPVLVSLDSAGDLKALGFVTQRSLADIGLAGYVAVYFPQSYNFAGNLVVVPASSVTPVRADSSAVMAFIVSGGVTDLKHDRWSDRRQEP